LEPRTDPGPPSEHAADPAALELPEEERVALAACAPAALERFYELYFDRVYGYVRRLLHEDHLAEDVTQDIFMHLHRSFEGYDPSRPLRPWVYTVATNKVRDHWRSRRHRDGLREVSATTEEGADYDGTPAVDGRRGPDEALAADELSAQVAAAIEDLPEIMRTTLVLRYYEGLSFAEIGAMIDRNETAVRKRYSRALEELRRRLGPVIENG
jgi:RNA polymerase sigma-70 factor (ECF subfamily)